MGFDTIEINLVKTIVGFNEKCDHPGQKIYGPILSKKG